MPSAQTHIPTIRAGRYLVQLCQHLNQIDRHARHGGATDDGGTVQIRRVEYTKDHGVIEFASGTCTLDATDAALAIRLTAVHGDALLQMQQMFAARLATIGRRDNLVVIW